jgi:outer membrane lipoprotein-sorting protein
MSITVPTGVRRWLVPASAALAVIGGGVAIGVVTNAADSALPPRSAEELLADLQTAQVDGLQGTLMFRADLGLPPLPVPSLGSADLGSLISGTHTLRVWYAHPGQARIALLGRDSETDIITNGTDVWVWSSRDRTAVHAAFPQAGMGGLIGTLLRGGPAAALPVPSALPSLPDGASLGGRPAGAVHPDGWDPTQMASIALNLLELLETDVTTDSSATVAGRRAYELTLTPRDQRALVKSVIVAIDAETHLPLRLAVLARDGGAPAFEVAFTEIRFTRPDPAQFEFRPPPGTTVVEADEFDPGDWPGRHPDTTGSGDQEPGDQPPGEPEPTESAWAEPGPDAPTRDTASTTERRMTVIGRGWTMVLVVRAPGDNPMADVVDFPMADLVDLLPTVRGDWGSGRLLSTRLFSVLLTDDGRLLAGAVPPDLLYAAAADPAAQLGS